MTNETWRGVIIRSIPPTTKWLPVIPSLYAMSSSANIISTLLAHGMILGREIGNKASPGTGSLSTILAARMTEGCTNPNCKAKKCTTHITANCYWPGGGKEGQFPPNFGQRSKANIATTTSTPGNIEHFALSAQIPTTSGQSGILVETLTDCCPVALISKGFQNF